MGHRKVTNLSADRREDRDRCVCQVYGLRELSGRNRLLMQKC